MTKKERDLKAAAPRKTPSPERFALVRLLWRSAADGDSCDRKCESFGEPALDICLAMRALDWGLHWNRRTFERRAVKEASEASARQRPQAVKSEQP